MKMLSTPDGKKIAVKHVVTVDYGVDGDRFRRDSFAYLKAESEVEKFKGQPKYEEQLKAALAAQFPQGEPQFKDYFRTKVTATDGQTYWVEQDMNSVVRAVLEA